MQLNEPRSSYSLSTGINNRPINADLAFMDLKINRLNRADTLVYTGRAEDGRFLS